MPPALPGLSGNSVPTVMSSGLVQGFFRSGETAARRIVLEVPSVKLPRPFAGRPLLEFQA